MPRVNNSNNPSKVDARSKVKERLIDARYALMEFAEMVEWAFSRKNYMAFAEYEDWQRRQYLKEQREWLYELKRRKWIETKTIGDRIVARLTEQGWQRALRDKISNEKKKCESGVCIVIFDIPEKQRFTRNLLRRFLKEWGFKRLQHSVWMTDKDVIEPVMLLLQRRKLDQWIRVVQGEVLNPKLFDSLRAYRYKAGRAVLIQP